MIIYKRNVVTQKTPSDVLKIIQSSTYHNECEINLQSFSIRCPKRGQRGHIMLVPIKGQLKSLDDATKVILELHAGVEVLIGLSVFALGLAMMLLRIVSPVIGKPTHGVMTMGMGVVISLFYWLRGIEAVDLLEHKITR